MDISAKYRLGLWGITTLVVLNLGLMGLLWFERIDDRPVGGPRGGTPNPNEFFVRELMLSEKQADSLLVLYERHKGQIGPIRGQIFDLNRQVIEELFTGSPDSARVRELTEAIGAKQARFESAVYDHFDLMRDLCRPDQQEILKQLIVETLERAKLPPPPPGLGPPDGPGPPGDRPPPPRDGRRPPPGDGRPPPPGSGR